MHNGDLDSYTLLTDLYQLSMAYGYYKSGRKDEVGVFNLFFRKNPFQGNYVVSCGLNKVIEYIENFNFSSSDIKYLKSINGNDDKPLFDSEFLKYLSNIKFEGDIDAIEEGRIVFPHEPLLRLKAPIIIGQLLETTLLNIVNFHSLIATKTSRITKSAGNDPVLEFGLRRAQGFDGALSATYSSIVGGAAATSNVLAGKLFDIPVKGTHAHSWIMSFSSEEEAFTTYADIMPNNCVFLVDTYDTLKGVEKAILVAKDLEKSGSKMIGIRLDSGDLADLSIKARQLLDKSGFSQAKIFASNDLDEYRVKKLKELGAKIDVWGIGTKLVTAYDQPALGGVYKLAALSKDNITWDYKIKKSEDLIKVSNPGILQVSRYVKDNKFCFDVIENENFKSESMYIPFNSTEALPISKSLNVEKLLKPIYKSGKLVYEQKSPMQSNMLRVSDLSMLESSISVNEKSKKEYSVGLEKSLYELKLKLLKDLS